MHEDEPECILGDQLRAGRMLGREPRLAEGVARGGPELVDQAGERRERHNPEQRRAAPAAPDKTETTDWHWGVGAEGGIVSNAKDTATFLTALMRGKMLDRQQLTQMQGENFWQRGEWSGCAGQAYGWSGGGSGYKTDVWVSGDGSRVAVLLLNARHYDTAQPAADQAAHDTLARLYCGA